MLRTGLSRRYGFRGSGIAFQKRQGGRDTVLHGNHTGYADGLHNISMMRERYDRTVQQADDRLLGIGTAASATCRTLMPKQTIGRESKAACSGVNLRCARFLKIDVFFHGNTAKSRCDAAGCFVKRDASRCNERKTADLIVASGFRQGAAPKAAMCFGSPEKTAVRFVHGASEKNCTGRIRQPICKKNSAVNT